MSEHTATGKVVWCEQALPHAGDGDD